MADLDGLKAAQEHVIAALNRRDLDGWLALLHDDIVYLNAVASFAVEGKVALRQVAEAQFKMSESMSVTLINPHYRVFEHTGIVWGYSALSIKSKDGPPQTIFTRANGVYAKVNGKWLMMALHLSRLPAEN
jgi:ketosteroid isomerase-like protein